MLKIKPKSESTKLNDQSILELFDYSELEKSYKTMKISWYHKVRLTIYDLYKNRLPLMSLTLIMLFPLISLSIMLNVKLLAIISTIIIFTPILVYELPYNRSISNVCKKIKNYFNGDSVMEAKFHLLKQKLLTPEGKQILISAIHNNDYGYIVKEIIANLLNNDDIELLGNILILAHFQEQLKNQKQIEENKANNFQEKDLVKAFKNYITY